MIETSINETPKCFARRTWKLTLLFKSGERIA